MRRMLCQPSGLLMKCISAMVLLGVTSFIHGCGGGVTQPANKELIIESDTMSFDKGVYPQNMDIFPLYRIVPGDVLDVLFQIQTWKEVDSFPLDIDHQISVKFVYSPELNETQNVQPDGVISLPYLGEVYVVGLTVHELTELLRERYKKILRDPELYVVVPEFRTSIKELKTDLHTAPRGLSRLVTVRPDGYVTFPLAGEVLVAGKTISDVNKILNERYKEVLPGLHCDLFLHETAGSRIYVLGDVNNPGSYMITKPITILEALSMCGGHRTTASLSDLLLVRRYEHRFVIKHLDLAPVLTMSDTNLSLFVMAPDDILYVPRIKAFDYGDFMRSVSDILLFNGWSVGNDLFDGSVLGKSPSWRQ